MTQATNPKTTHFTTTKKKVLGKMKDGCGGLAIEEVVAVRSLMYSLKKSEQKNIRKAKKGMKKNVIEKEITHRHYKEALIERKHI